MHPGLVVLMLAVSCAAAPQPGPDPNTVALKHVESADVVYIEHRGPDWTLGRVFTEIGAFMAEHHQAGPMFARYLEDPTRADASRLRTQVGFFVAGPLDVAGRYRRATLPAHLAACLVVRGPYAQSAAHYREVFQWIDANGYAPGKGITEIYPQRQADQGVVEIRIPVVGKRGGSSAPGRRRDGDAAPPQVAALIKEQAYTRLADVLVPEENALPEGHRKWLAEVVDRLRVIREIVEIKNGRGAGGVGPMITPIVDRAGWLNRYALTEAAASPEKRSVAAAVIERQKADVLLALDRVMVRAHLNALTPNQIHDKLAHILADVQPIVEGRSIKAMQTPHAGTDDDPD